MPAFLKCSILVSSLCTFALAQNLLDESQTNNTFLPQSCISEDKKYQGGLYKEKPAKQPKRSVKISDANTNANPPRKAYVEDAPEGDDTPVKAVTIVEPPSEAPPPPAVTPAQAQTPVNVFDFLVPSDTPPAPKAATSDTKSTKKKMDKYDPAAHGSSVSLIGNAIPSKPDPEYDNRGFSYGSEPVPTTQRRQRPKVEYFTPAPKDLERDLEVLKRRESTTNGKSTDKKRKRHNVEDLDLSNIRRSSHDSDELMSDAPPAPSFSTGLTGGLNRMLSNPEDDPRDERERGDPPSPIKRPRPTSTYIIKERKESRPGSSTTASSSALVRVKHRRVSDEDRPRKHHRSSHHEDVQSKSYHDDTHHKSRHHRSHRSRSRSRSRPTSTAASMKAIEYRRVSPGSDDSSINPGGSHTADRRQVVVHSSARAELFARLITKGPESEQGCSINKALKRYHRERAADKGVGRLGVTEKGEEEKELWRSLRLKRNSRGEIVVFF